ncbi:hypothetical protein [Oleisolibacter albus]|uniref:hypothetical protein n=1 Tax=Oleisolibacter albus TaxID=2171757 RepID=UPI0012D8156B|nr:hypothetical protein [Oleisolibacter albus]
MPHLSATDRRLQPFGTVLDDIPARPRGVRTRTRFGPWWAAAPVEGAISARSAC